MSTTTDTKNSTDALVAKMQAKANAKAPHKDKESRSAKWRSYFRTLFIVWLGQIVTGVILFMIAYANGWMDGYNYGYRDPNGHVEPFNGAKMWEAIGIMTQWGVVLLILLVFGAIIALAIQWDPKKTKPKTDKKH